MKTNLSKWFSIRKPGKDGIGIKIKKQKQNHDLSNTELLSANFSAWEHSNRIHKIKLDTSYQPWEVKGIKL